jgi:hypothetical protein
MIRSRTHTPLALRSAGRSTTAPRHLRRLLRSLLAVSTAGAVTTAPSKATAASHPVRPEYRWLVDAPLFVAGAGTYLASRAMTVDTRVVPAAGLDPSAIHLAWDRHVVGN